MVDWARGKVGELRAGRGDLRLAGRKGECNDRVGVGHVERTGHPGDPVGRVQSVNKNGLELGHAVAIGIAQQSDAVAALSARACTRLHLTLYIVLRSERLGPGTVALYYEDVTVWQSVYDPRVHQSGRHRLDAHAGWNAWGLTRLPANRLRHAHRGYKILLGLGQVGVGPILLCRVTALAAASGNQGERH